ncbi:MAG: purine-binding chemotaxis protein CheW [Bacteroidales bacterium]|nr:purine-binding chemotaxis protein CheW [Bacteroidales bacterium]
MKNTYLSFVIGDEQYAVNVFKVLEVLEKQVISRVPNAPHFIKGIVNFRGDIVPVFESRDKFNLPPRPEGSSYVIIVLDLSKENEIFRIGAVVDRVKDVLEIDDAEIKAVPAMSKDFNTKFLNGIYKLDNKFILLLDVEKVFTDEEVTVMSKIAEV